MFEREGVTTVRITGPLGFVVGAAGLVVVFGVTVPLGVVVGAVGLVVVFGVTVRDEVPIGGVAGFVVLELFWIGCLVVFELFWGVGFVFEKFELEAGVLEVFTLL